MRRIAEAQGAQRSWGSDLIGGATVRVIEKAGVVDPDRLLHRERRVGAEHHHFAMRHVDDAHDTEGDGQANCSQEQD